MLRHEGKVDYQRCRTKAFFVRGIDRLRTASDKGMRVCLLCSESKPWECHRSKLIGWVLQDQGIDVEHVLPDGPPVRRADAMAMTRAASGRAQHPLAGGLAPAWAVEWGEDQYGAFAAFAVDASAGAGQPGRVQQRLRWIPPGTFEMGSPKREKGRFDDEGPQHAVTLTRGYWLGETPVTQALWVAVMGENPSRFRGEGPEDLERPVEQVSWDDCQSSWSG